MVAYIKLIILLLEYVYVKMQFLEKKIESRKYSERFEGLFFNSKY